MSILLNKSENNCLAAELLHQEEYYASSVHCSYYSSLQLIKHIIINVLGENENESIGSGEPSNEFLINNIVKKIYLKGNNAREFNNAINQLKRKRVEADYKEVIIDENDSNWAMGKSYKINNDLKTSFQI